MPTVHPSSCVAPGAELANGVVVGPFCYIEDGVTIGAATVLESHVTVRTGTTLGMRNTIAQGAVVGGDPQDRRHKGELTFLTVGDDNVVREYATLHRASGEGKHTVIGDRNYLMAFTHVAHNCQLGSDITVANNVGISGHVTIEDKVTIGGMTGVHQFVRIGKLAMVGGMSRIVRDVPPFMITEGLDQTVHDINAVGLRRTGISQEGRLALHKACKFMFKAQLSLSSAIETIQREVELTEEVRYLIAYMERLYEGKSGRGDQR